MSSYPIPVAYSAAAPTPDQLTMFRAQLEEQRRFRLDQLAELRAVDPHNTSDVTEVLAAGARAALQSVLAALHRMDSGTYGVCTACGTRLQVERLEVLPQVGECLPCRQSAAARTGR